MYAVIVLLSVISGLVNFTSAKRDLDVYCGACIALVDEMNYSIDQVDPKQRLQVGSFRVDPKGNQRLQEVPLARSELHLTELLESVCSRMSDYAMSADPVSGKKTYIRTSPRDGSRISHKSIIISGDIHSQLKFACETLIEEHEEDIVALFRNNPDDVLSDICIDTIDVCTANSISLQKMATITAQALAVDEAATRNSIAVDPEEMSSAEGGENTDSNTDTDSNEGGDADSVASSSDDLSQTKHEL